MGTEGGEDTVQGDYREQLDEDGGGEKQREYKEIKSLKPGRGLEYFRSKAIFERVWVREILDKS